MKKTETKTTETKTTKATTKKTAVKKTAAVKKTPEKKAAVKKTAAVKTTAKEVETKIILQYGELSIDSATLRQNVENYLMYDRDMPVADQVNVEIYVKPEEGRAYVVVGGVEEGSIGL